MTGLIPSGGTSEISALDKLLTLLLDPKAAQTKLDELRGASAAAEQMIGQANASMAKSNEMAKALAEREAKLDTDQKSLDIDADEVSRGIATLAERDQALKTREGDLDARELRFTSRMDQERSDLETREQAFAARVEDREAAVAQREQTVSEREVGAKTAFDEAQASKSEYEQRIAKLNAAMGH